MNIEFIFSFLQIMADVVFFFFPLNFCFLFVVEVFEDLIFFLSR